MGSSIVTMWTALLASTWSIMAARREVGLVGLLELLVQIGTDQVPEQLLGHVRGEVGPVQDD